MQFEDPRSILEAAAARPGRGIDAAALVREGTRLRRMRFAVAAAGVAVVVTAASASFGALTGPGQGDPGPGPAGPTTQPDCDLQRAKLRFRENLTSREAAAIARAAERAMTEDGASGTTVYGPTGEPRSLYVSGVRKKELAELLRELEAQVESLTRRLDRAALHESCPETERATPTRPAPDEGGEVVLQTAGAGVDVRRAECRTGTIRLDGGPAEFRDGTKWCRFVLLVDNEGSRSIRLDLDDQLLRTTGGEGTTPWEDAMSGFSTRLFTSPIPAGRQRMGQLVFLLPPHDVPAALELSPRPGFAPVSFPLEYDCALDLREERLGRCFLGRPAEQATLRQTWVAMDVALYHCGVGPVVFQGRRWVVPDPPFDATNAPEGFAGHGLFKQRSAADAVYYDDSGATIRFEASEDWEPPPCD